REAAEEDLARAVAELGAGAPADARRAALAAAARLQAAAGRPRAAIATADAALALAPDGPWAAPDRLRLEIVRGAALAATGDLHGATRGLGAALRRARALRDAPAAASALLELGLC